MAKLAPNFHGWMRRKTANQLCDIESVCGWQLNRTDSCTIYYLQLTIFGQLSNSLSCLEVSKNKAKSQDTTKSIDY